MNTRGPSVENLGGVFDPVPLRGVTPVTLNQPVNTEPSIENPKPILDNLMTVITVYQIINFISKL